MTYCEVNIYVKYYILHPRFKLVKLWEKMDVFKNIETLHTLPTVISSKNVVKNEYFSKFMQWRTKVFFGNEGGMHFALYKNVIF